MQITDRDTSGMHYTRAFSSSFGKRPLAKIGKNIELTAKLGEFNDIEHNKGSKYILKIKLF